MLDLLGKACAMNKKKFGSLQYLSLEKAFPTAINFLAFLDKFKVSDYAHELWYGDAKVAKDMTKEQLEPKFEFGLTYLNIGQSAIPFFNFKLKDYQKQKQPHWPSLISFLADNKIEILNLSKCQMNKNDMELISTCIY